MTKPNSALQNQDQVHLSAPSGPPMQAPLPIVATSHMMNAAVNAWHSWKSRDNGGCIQELGRLMWEHMADAAPSPALQAGGDETPVAHTILDVGFKYEGGIHTPTVLVGFAANDWD